MKKKEIWWKWLNIFYFGGGMLLSLIGIAITKICIKGVSPSVFGFWLTIYFVVLGVPFMLATNKLFLTKHSS